MGVVWRLRERARCLHNIMTLTICQYHTHIIMYMYTPICTHMCMYMPHTWLSTEMSRAGGDTGEPGAGDPCGGARVFPGGVASPEDDLVGERSEVMWRSHSLVATSSPSCSVDQTQDMTQPPVATTCCNHLLQPAVSGQHQVLGGEYGIPEYGYNYINHIIETPEFWEKNMSSEISPDSFMI